VPGRRAASAGRHGRTTCRSRDRRAEMSASNSPMGK
jgi:hypothetical protein